MAIVPATKIDTPHDAGILLYKWSGMAADDTGAPVFAPGHNDKTIQVSLFTQADSAVSTLSIEGSLDEAAPVWVELSNSAGDALEFSAVGMSEVLENVAVIRPNLTTTTTGTATIDVWLLVTS